MSARTWITAGLALLFAIPAHANYQVRGKFLYRDREFGPSGFTGTEPNRPIRLAEVELVDASTSVVLASGATAMDGSFTLNIIDNVVRTVRVRVRSAAPASSTFKCRVLNHGPGGGSLPYAVSSPDYPGHNPNIDIDFTATPVVAVQGAGGDAFNTFDVMLTGCDFMASLTGSRPSRLLTVFWYQNSKDGTYYRHSDASIHLYGLSSDSDSFDDSVILHELGHYVEFNLGNSDNPGGGHSLGGFYDLRLTWSEGWATFFQNMVRAWLGLARADIYVDTSGQPGPGHQFISYEVETPSVGQPGANNEVAVNAILWDAFDNSTTQDVSVGIDDDPLAMPNAAAEIWEIQSEYFRGGATSISLEDFWDGWFSPSVANGFASELEAVFAAHGVEYFDDTFEENDSVAQARSVVAGSGAQHHSIYSAGDRDWIQVAVAGGGAYVFETINLKNGADTRLDLYASNGSTLLLTNDDRTTGDPSSRIAWTAQAAGLVYLRCIRKPDLHTYGSYDLVVSGPAVPVEIEDVTLATLATGIEIRWRARPEVGFSHFDIERGLAADGAFEVRATGVPLVENEMQVHAFVDTQVEAGRAYFYRIVGVETNGERRRFGPYGALAPAPAWLVLHAPSPNPFNPSTVVGFEFPRAVRAGVRIFAADGRLVRVLAPARIFAAGNHTLRWDGRDEQGRTASSGVYVVRLDAGGESRTQRAVLVR